MSTMNQMAKYVQNLFKVHVFEKQKHEKIYI